MEFRFEGSEVFIRRDPETGDVVLSRRPDSWDGLFELYGKGDVPDDFMGPVDRKQPPQDRDPLGVAQPHGSRRRCTARKDA
jgi:antitoxin VapB